MYKLASRSNQRRYKVHEIDFQPQGHVESDFIPTADNLSLDECHAERAKLLLDKARAENELIAAKTNGNMGQITRLGHTLQTYANRLGLLNKRIKHLNACHSRDVHDKAFREALKEIVPADILERVYARQQEIIEASKPSWFAGDRA